MSQAGVATVGIIASDTPYGQEGFAAVAAAAARDDLAVAERLRIKLGEPDTIDAAVERVARWQPAVDAFAPAAPEAPPAPGPDAVVVCVPAPHAAEATQALRGTGYSRPVYLDMLAADELFLAPDPGEATLVFTSTLVVDTRIATSPAVAEQRRWFSDYVARYGTYHAHSSFAADALLVVGDAVRRAHTLDRAAICDRIESTLIDGLTGQIRFTADQHSGLHPISLTTLSASDGRWR